MIMPLPDRETSGTQRKLLRFPPACPDQPRHRQSSRDTVVGAAASASPGPIPLRRPTRNATARNRGTPAA